jgi:diguanylate cyclase (GGDEF)-like protein
MISEAEILGANVLIVDDQPANISLLSRLMDGAGYTRVSSTLEPLKVCELHRAKRYDLILLDIEMPDLDGFAVMAGLKEIEADTYVSVLALTAKPEHKLRALSSGAKDFVSKPFDLAEILVRVHNLIEVRLWNKAAVRTAKALELLALRDPLTGLANRRMVGERMQAAFADASKTQNALGVVYLDLDGFKSINDTLGHGVGDQVLKQVADRLVAAVRQGDTVARLGGDEFMIGLWACATEADAAKVATKVIEAVSKPYDIDGHVVRVTASAGIALYPTEGEDSETLMNSADQALQAAKKAGKNVFRVSRRSAN